MKWLILNWFSVFLIACTNINSQNTLLPATIAQCLKHYEQSDQILSHSRSLPHWPKPIEDFPYYKINRFWAEFTQHELSRAANAQWLAQLGELDLQQRRVGLKTLPAQYQQQLPLLERCAEQLQAFDLNQPQRLARLKNQAQVPDDYLLAARIIGLYPIVVLPVQYGIQNLHEELRQTFATPLNALPQHGQLVRYYPAQGQSATLSAIARDKLDVPRPSQQQWQALFAYYAPIWEIDVAGGYDRPGRPVWRGIAQPAVDSRQPLTFYYPSYTWWQDRPVVQLNYLIWFDQRPLEHAFDILGGALDAVQWRVTLDADLQPLLYDSIHACGCYHLLFPTPALRLKPAAEHLPEPPFVAQTAPDNERMVIRIASGTHFIERVYAAESDPQPAQTYQLLKYETLYSSPDAAGKPRSLFRADGIVAGSERAERGILWPLGIAEPGAMRERGFHAIAFVGRRHFDDADLLEQLFIPALGASNVAMRRLN